MTENEPITVQVIIPVYNAGESLAACLDSLRAQSFAAWRAIVVDDLSTDNSREIMRRYEQTDSRFLCLYNETNSGVSRTRNRAIGELDRQIPYTAFLDSDDRWEPGTLEKLCASADKYDADIVQCRFVYDFPGGKTVLPRGAFDREMFFERGNFKPVYRRMLTGINMNHVCMKLIRTGLLCDMRFNTSMKTAEDLELMIRLFERVKRYAFIPDVLYHYTRSGSGLTGVGLSGSEKLAANRRIARLMTDSLPGWGMDCLAYRLLARFRPYLLIVSKLFRTAREKIKTKS